MTFNIKTILKSKTRPLKKKKPIDDDEEEDQNNNNDLRRTESTSSYMQRRRNIYVNMELPASEYDEKGRPLNRHFVSNRIRTAKYTPLNFLPKNLFEQFRNVANLYFLFLVILQCIPLFGVTEPAVSALPLIAILVITAIKDAIEDWKRNQSDQKMNHAKTRVLHNWRNVNTPIETKGPWYFLHIFLGYFSALAGLENKYSNGYRMAKLHKREKKSLKMEYNEMMNNNNMNNDLIINHNNNNQNNQNSQNQFIKNGHQSIDSTTTTIVNSSTDQVTTNHHQNNHNLLTTVRQRSDTLRSELSSIFKPNGFKRQPYRPGSIPHSVLFRTATTETSNQPIPNNHTQVSFHEPPESEFLYGGRRPSNSIQQIPTNDSTNNNNNNNNNNINNTSSIQNNSNINSQYDHNDCIHIDCGTRWKEVQWQDLHVGDYVQIRNDQDIPADVVVLSTSEPDSICYIETQNLDGETNLKVRQGLPGTQEIQTVHDCEKASFYIESEPPHVNLYQYSAVMRWTIDSGDTNTIRSGVSHEKSDAISYNNILLRGCTLRNTEWVIGIVVFTGNDTKIMLNSGQTPSKRSKMAKKTNPHVVANFIILSVLCIVSSIMASVQFNASGSSRKFDFGIEGSNQHWSGFVTFWVTLILYQNIVPISLYVSVEIVKTFAAYFIYADIDMYHEETDTPCIAKTWNISDDLGQIEYIFSDKTGTLTQNVMEYKKCTINGVSYGLGKTEAQIGADIRAKRNSFIQPEKRSSYISNNNSNIDRYLDRDDHDNRSQFTIEKEEDADELQIERELMFDKQRQLFKNPYVSDHPTFIDPKFFEDLGKGDAHATAMQHFFTTLALCHTVIAERPDPKQFPDKIEYKAQSPDEAALVATARDMGFVFLGKEGTTLIAEIKGERQTFDLLNVLEFNSTRKRMSVIIRPHGSDKIVLLCKGADSIIYERLCEDFGPQKDLEKQQMELRETCSQHLENYANEGLRTLCLSYRFIAPEEYNVWQKKYQEASSSIINREERIDAVSEEIEKNMLLIGGTAIEDRLQDGVPETIAELARSGIKLWVLTGDKTETAINIGYACNLLTPNMDLVILKATNREEAKEQLLDALEKTKNFDKESTQENHYALVIDGTTLKYGLEPDTKDMVLALGTRCSSVICCRVSPKQKAQVVRLVKKGLKVMTLAIGDGANDVSMIQEANVGVGISGVEGRQAVMASDYAIAQFRYLKKLLIVHGRWSYLRTAEMIMGFFFKNIVWTFVLFWYQIFCQFNGTMVFDYALVTLYNLVFTSLPIIFLGIWDQDLSAQITVKYPELYRMGIRNDKFKTWQFWLTCIDSIYQSAVCFFFPYMLLIAGNPDPTGHDGNGVYEIGTIISGITVCVANFFVAFSLFSYTWIQLFIIGISILLYYAFIAVYSQFNSFIFAGQIRLCGTGLYWLVLILTLVAAFIPRVVAKHYIHQYIPFDNDIVREIELVLKKRKQNKGDPSSDYTNNIKLERV